jgi:hypothetical protein
MKLILIKKGHEYIIKFTTIVGKKIYLLFYMKVIFTVYEIFYKISKKKKKYITVSELIETEAKQKHNGTK